MIAAEHERQGATLDSVCDEAGDARAGRLDLGQVARLLVGHGDRLDHRRVDVAPVDDLHPELAETALEVCVPDRRGPHVDAAPPLAEVDGGPDHGDRRALRRSVHRTSS